MPELPEVETVLRDLVDAGVPGRRILYADIFWAPLLQNVSPRSFQRLIRGQLIARICRHGKYLLFGLGGTRWMILHLGMSGGLILSTSPPDHTRLVLHLEEDEDLFYRDPRKFGRLWLTTDPGEIIGRLGPDALATDLTAPLFIQRIRKYRRQIKPLLMDQTVVAGIGNIYADEALWRARIHPLRNSAQLSDAELRRLFQAVRHVLRQSIRHRGTSLGATATNYRTARGAAGRNRGYLAVYHRTGQPCRRCRTPIRRIVVGQRSTHFCPRCQPP